MKKIINDKLLFAISIVVVLSIIPKYIFADTFELSYTLTEGGKRLELDPANPYKGLKLEVSSDVACRYEIIQNITQPLQNRDNPGVVIGDNFVLRGLRGTNRFGTFRIPTNDILVRSNEILYTSDTAGDADSFTLVYGITNPENITPGYYQGQLSFTLRPIGSTRSEVTKYLYVYISISQERREASIEISTPTGSKTIMLNPKKEETRSADILVKINGSFENLFSIIQFLPNPLESNEGNRIDYDKVHVAVKEVRKGAGASEIPLSSNPQTLYTSGPNGDADESFIITYSLQDLSQQKAGRYTARIQYFLDEMGVQNKIETLGLEVENERMFELMITPQDQKDAIEFRNLKPKEEPRISKLTIEIKTNVSKLYQVTQNVYSELTDKEGNTIPAKYFTMQTESTDTKGRLKFPQKQEVPKGETTLFISDTSGSADKFDVIYELTCPLDIKAGDYSTRVTYSLIEI